MRQEPPAVPITFPVPFMVKSMNLYLFPAEPLTLLDTGPKTPPARQAIRKTLETRGYGYRDLKRIIITHGHVDHFGLARELAQASGAAIYIHPYDAYKLLHGYSFIREKLPLLREAGVPDERLKELEGWCINADKLFDPLDEVHPLQENEQISFDSFSLKIIHCPGHSQGHICLYDEERKELYGGDHILKHITPNPAIEPSPSAPEKRSHSLVQYLDSLQKIDRLNPSCIFPAHGPVIDSPRKRIKDIQRHHLRRKERLQGLLNGRGSTAYDLGQKLFGIPKEMDIFLIVSEVLAHLDLLLKEEKAVALAKNGVIYYSTP
ncbi:MAG: MBL fold metallo-hydrolase [Deltaproteobacteria bacterium]|nr:MBL fold metallo-hydrolase [Deltaproteobacteria bacterium]